MDSLADVTDLVDYRLLLLRRKMNLANLVHDFDRLWAVREDIAILPRSCLLTDEQAHEAWLLLGQARDSIRPLLPAEILP